MTTAAGTLDNSAIMVVTMETAEGRAFSSGRVLPFAGIKYLYFRSGGARCYTDPPDHTEYAPENLQPAGIFLAVELDQELAGNNSD